MTQPAKIITIAASNSVHSINKRLLQYAGTVLQSDLRADIDIEPLDLMDHEMPIYSPEREAIGIPQQAHDFYQKIGAADGVMISFAEHNGTYTAAFKNIFDWTSRIEMQVFQDNPVMLMAASIGPGGAQHVLATANASFPNFGARLTSSFSVGLFDTHFDHAANRLTTPQLDSDLHSALRAFKAALRTTGHPAIADVKARSR